MSQALITPPTIRAGALTRAGAITRFAGNALNLHRAILILTSAILTSAALLALAICLIQTGYPTNRLAAFGIALLAHAIFGRDLTDPAIRAGIQP